MIIADTTPSFSVKDDEAYCKYQDDQGLCIRSPAGALRALALTCMKAGRAQARLSTYLSVAYCCDENIYRKYDGF